MKLLSEYAIATKEEDIIEGQTYFWANNPETKDRVITLQEYDSSNTHVADYYFVNGNPVMALTQRGIKAHKVGYPFKPFDLDLEEIQIKYLQESDITKESLINLSKGSDSSLVPESFLDSNSFKTKTLHVKYLFDGFGSGCYAKPEICKYTSETGRSFYSVSFGYPEGYCFDVAESIDKLNLDRYRFILDESEIDEIKAFF